jgi:hypothetical protein
MLRSGFYSLGIIAGQAGDRKKVFHQRILPQSVAYPCAGPAPDADPSLVWHLIPFYLAIDVCDEAVITKLPAKASRKHAVIAHDSALEGAYVQ